MTTELHNPARRAFVTGAAVAAAGVTMATTAQAAEPKFIGRNIGPRRAT